MSWKNNMVILAIMALPFFATGQFEIIKEDVNLNEFNENKFGPNGKVYIHPYLTTGRFFDTDELESTSFSSNIFKHGYRAKFKLFEFLAVGLDLQYSRTSYELLKDSTTSSFFIPENLKEHHIRTNAIGVAPFIRINFDKRGDYLGKFLDVGVFGEYVFASRYVSKIDSEPSALNGGSDVQKLILKKLDYIEPLQYGAEVRIGFNYFSFFGRYRVSDFFKASEFVNGGVQYPSYETLIIGIELGLPGE